MARQELHEQESAVASLLKAQCNACGHDLELMCGHLMLCQQRRCWTCGQPTWVPVYKPEGVGVMTESQLEEYLKAEEDWHRGEEPFCEAERAVILRLTSICKCGGQLSDPEAEEQPPHRCPACLSTDLSVLDTFGLA